MKTSHVTAHDLRLFLTLDALLTEGGVTAAARRLGVTQSAVSHALRDLRHRLGDPVLVRSGNRLVPTPLVQSLLPSLRLGLTELARVLNPEQEFIPAHSTRTFTLATPDHPQFTVLPALIGRLRRDAPGVDVRIHPLGPGLREALAAGRLDAVLAGAEVEANLSLDQEVMRTRIISEPFCCVMRHDHPAAAGSFDLKAYLAHPHVLVSTAGGDRGIVDGVLAGIGLRRRVAVTVPSFPAAVWIAAASDLIATLPRAVVKKALPGLEGQNRVVVRGPPLTLPTSDAYLWWHPRFQHDPGHVWWRETLIAAFAALR